MKGAKMEKDFLSTLKDHIVRLHRYCESDGNIIWLHQAFGAVQFACMARPDLEEEIGELWDDWKPLFELSIYGIALNI